ncbi:hypothetical protein H7J87_12175 [Mycolicibacterium wolinskyi]|uniref:hypothetical protein n=1 Tax=Mycolicibacterium TaxID=1866885 RepID=UPI0010565CE4|nr:MULTISPECIES: hypothetical protein [Mycolicibacterium]MCV7286089.1 hypothetical protein [Mycolicibacterium wolinskyi]MCV7296285.1 hypothetical protein [Mycolicibacterium goodii]
MALARGESAGQGAQASTSGAAAVPESGGRGVAADALVTRYAGLGTDLSARQAYHTAEAEGLALNGSNHYATKTILASLAEDHDRSRDALIAAGMTAGIPQAKMQEVLDELKQATTTAASNVGQANQETHRTLTSAINTGASMPAPPKGMPGGAGLPPDVPSQLVPLLQQATQGPQMATGAVGQLITGLSGMTGAFVDPIGQLVSSAAQGGQAAADSVDTVGGESGEDGGRDQGDRERDGSQLVSQREDKDDENADDRGPESKDSEEEGSRRDGEPKTIEASGQEKSSVPTTHLASSGSTVQLDSVGGPTTHVSSAAAVADAPVGAGQHAAAAPASGVAQQQAMGGQLGAMGGSLGFGGSPAAGSQSTRTATARGGRGQDSDQGGPGDTSPGAAAALVGLGIESGSGPSAEIMFGARVLAHMVHQDSTLTAAAVAVFPMGMGVYAITCTPDALGAPRGGIATPHATMSLASLTSVPGNFRVAWAGITDPVAPLCSAIKHNFLARPEVIVALRAPGTPAVEMPEAAVVEVSMEQLLATDPVDDAAAVVEEVVAPEHIAPIIEEMAVEWQVPAEMDLATAFGYMRSRTWYETRNHEYVYAMAWWMVTEARTALAGGDRDHAAALAWQLLALPPAPSLTSTRS